MTKKNWSISTSGHALCPMLTLDDALDHAGALAWARCIWPTCEAS
nr:MAG TPA: hypothetical protein [Caudoviricetes sp.]